MAGVDGATEPHRRSAGATTDAATDTAGTGCKSGVGDRDDSNPCTTDSCVNSACTHVAVLDLTPCSASGMTGTCKKGVCQ